MVSPLILAISILYIWLYNNTQQSLWSAILLHWLYTYAAQVVSSGVTRSPLYNWLECLPYVVMAFVVVLIWNAPMLSHHTIRNAAQAIELSFPGDRRA